MKILAVHNYYQQPGGEDRVFLAESTLLESRGHSVVRYVECNSSILGGGSPRAAIDAVWSFRSEAAIGSIVRQSNPSVAHFHNTFPLISPSAYHAAQQRGVPVVQTLHNYRLLCPSATLSRNGAVCEDCLQRRSFLPALRHACYRGSRSATAAVATMLTIHRSVGTWRNSVDLYIALSEFSRNKLVEGGLPADRIVVKRNFVSPDPEMGEGRGDYALFVGRLSPEKGIAVLASAWKKFPDIPLVVVGDGPAANTEWPENVTWLGRLPSERVFALMKDARVLVFPSIGYESAPMTILEAFACGLPVIASNVGPLPEIVDDHRTGLLFRPGDADDLVQKVRWAFAHPEHLLEMRMAARREYETKYTAEIGYKALIDVYEMAIERRRKAA
jgi:glycosyltransferase involved in cell wall biosynthesis